MGRLLGFTERPVASVASWMCCRLAARLAISWGVRAEACHIAHVAQGQPGQGEVPGGVSGEGEGGRSSRISCGRGWGGPAFGVGVPGEEGGWSAGLGGRDGKRADGLGHNHRPGGRVCGGAGRGASPVQCASPRGQGLPLGRQGGVPRKSCS